MKKILTVLLLSECEKNPDYYNTVYRGQNTHNLIVLNNKLDNVLENQEIIIKNQEEIMKMLKGDK